MKDLIIIKDEHGDEAHVYPDPDDLNLEVTFLSGDQEISMFYTKEQATQLANAILNAAKDK